LGRGGRREAECLPRRRRKRPRMPPEPALSRAALPIRRVAALRSAPEVDLVVTTPQHSIRSIGPPGIGAGAALLRAERGAPAGLVARDFAIPHRQSHPSYAALDLGTNNCRLLVARPARGGFRVIDAFSRIVRLGEGLAATGELSETAMERTIEALRICAGKIAQRKVMAGRYVATEACRRAANCTAFIDRVRDEIGIDLEIISTAEEALLPFEKAHAIRREVRSRQVQMLGSSGTVTTLAGVHLALPRYVRALVDGSTLTFDQIELVSRHLAGLDIKGRAANPCVGQERA